MKKTVLDGYYASGDHECFCFDKLDGPGEYNRLFPRDDDSGMLERIEAMEANRVYPSDLLPEAPRQPGRWTITIEFVPGESK